MKRREFLYQTALVTSSFLLPLGLSSSVLAAPSEESGHIYFGEAFNLFRFDTEIGRMDSMDCGIRSHSFLAYSSHPEKILAMEKWNKKIAIIDFRSRKVVKQISAPGHSNFYGHACFSADQKQLYTVQVDHQSGQAYLVIFESETLNFLDQVPLTKGGAHELSFLPSSSILAIACTGWAPLYGEGPLRFERLGYSKIIFFDVISRSVVAEKVLQDPYLSLAHLKVASDGRVFAISDIMSPFFAEKFHGRLYDASLTQDLEPWAFPASARPCGELLSLELNEKEGLVAVTNPVGERTYLYSMSTKKAIAEIVTDSKSVGWSRDGKSLFSMAAVKKRQSPDPHLGLKFRPVPNGGLGLSSHMLFVNK